MKKILVVGMTENPGGIEAMIMGLLPQLDPNQYHLDFIANTPYLAYEDALKGFGCKIYHITSRHNNRIAFYRDLQQVFSRYASEYDAIWQNSNSLANIDYLIYAKRYGIPIRIIHCHNSTNSEGIIRGVLHNINRRRITAYATHYWTVSDEASQWYFGSDYRTLPHYRVISNTVDISRFSYSVQSREEIRRQLNIPTDAVVALNVGRLHPQKNQTLVINIVAKLVKTEGLNIHLILVGEGQLRQHLQTIAFVSGIVDRVHFIGAVDDAAPYYSAADLFFFPSLYEGISFSLLEAQANGIPCLASDGIARECLVSSNIYVESLASSDEQWARSFIQALRMGRLTQSGLSGTRFDRQKQGNVLDQLWNDTSAEAKV